MSQMRLSRRDALGRAGWVGAAAVLGGVAAGAGAPAAEAGPGEVVFCLNTGTIRGQKLGVVREIEVAAQAGYQAIEPWVEAIEQYRGSGGSLKDLKQRIADAGLTVESAIGFAEWIVDDDARRAKGLEQAKRDMDLVAQIGGKRLAAPPAGATGPADLDLHRAADRYRALLEVGDQLGIVPELEVWGFSKNVHTLGEAAFVAIESGHAKACVLADVFHLYKGGSDFRGLRLMAADALPVFHMNDYPADPPRDKINDSFRVFPGDGVAPVSQILRDLRLAGGRKVLSLELFNKKYYEQDALEVAKAGLAKMRAAVAAAKPS